MNKKENNVLAVCLPDKHSETGASGAERWMNCPGSVALSRGIAGKDSVPAMEGTAAHKLGEMILKSETNFEEAEGKIIKVQRMDEGFKDFPVTSEMIEAVKIYTDYVMFDRPDQMLSTAFYAERHVDITPLVSTMNPETKLELFGKVDASIDIHADPPAIRVVDFKYGIHIPVYAENNAQQLFYATSFLPELSADDQRAATDYQTYYEGMISGKMIVELVIIQPRCKRKENPVDVWKLSMSELRAWAGDKLKPAALRTEEKDAPLKAGSWCKFCKAKPTCPEIQKNKGNEMSLLLNRISSPVTEIGEKKLSLTDQLQADVSKMDPLDVALTLTETKTLKKQLAVITKLIKEFEEKALLRAMKSKDIPGYTVGFKAGNRNWKNTENAKVILDLLLSGGTYKTSGLKTPAQVEKLLKEKGHDMGRVLKDEIVFEKGSEKIIPAKEDDDVFGWYTDNDLEKKEK